MANVKTLRDIIANPDTRLSPSEMRAAYGVSGTYKDENGVSVARNIEKVTINGNVFTDYSAFSFLWEKSYVSSPTRSGNGTIGNLNSYTTFLTPHLKIDFGLMSIDSYRKLMQLIYTSNEFLVTCYDVVNNKNTTNKMYFSTEEMPKLWTIVDALNGDETAIMLLGVQDYTVEMIGTNNDVDEITVNYYLNSPQGNDFAKLIGSEVAYLGSEIILGEESNIDINKTEVESKGYLFNFAWRLGTPSGTRFEHRHAVEISKSIVDETSNSISFYAAWIPTNTYTLTYSYGIGEPQIDDNGQEILSKQVRQGESIGVLPTSPIPSVEYEGKKYTGADSPYENGAWYKTSVKVPDAQKIESGMSYWADKSSIIYQHFDVKSYAVRYFVNGNLFSYDMVKYNQPVPLPIFRNYSTFKGWSKRPNDTVISGMTMPPYDLSLYAIFEE